MSQRGMHRHSPAHRVWKLPDLSVPRTRVDSCKTTERFCTSSHMAIDDWLLAPLTDAERRDLLEVIEDRSERRSTVIASQLPPTEWHAVIGEPRIAAAICDRLIHRAHKLPLRERPCATRRRGAPEQGNHASGHHRRDAAGRLARRSSLLGDPGRSRSAAAAVGRARPVENAHNAFPTRSLDAQNASTRSHQAYSLIVMERTTVVR
jgi:hypothetical protein